MESSQVLFHVFEDPDYNISDASTSDEDDDSDGPFDTRLGSRRDVLDAAQVCFFANFLLVFRCLSFSF